MRRGGPPSAGVLQLAWGLGLLVLLAGGCGGEETGTISGTVAYRGRPLPGGFVDFVSAKGKVVTGRIERDGSYVVDGVPVGPANISVRDLSGGLTDEARGPKLPLRYRSAEGSGLRYTVTRGQQEYAIDLPD